MGVLFAIVSPPALSFYLWYLHEGTGRTSRGVPLIARARVRCLFFAAAPLLRVLNAHEHRRLVLLDETAPLELREAGHGHEVKVADVGLPHGNKFSEEALGPVLQLRGPGGALDHNEVDRPCSC